MNLFHNLTFIYVVISIAFLFDFINGFHDAANSTATLVATKMLRPLTAVLWTAFFNFIAFLFFKLKVATMIGTGLVQVDVINPCVIFAALVAAILFNLTTWYLGLPSSSSHALMGGLMGSAFAVGGWKALIFSGILKIIISIVISPLLGLMLAACLIRFFGFLNRYWSGNKFNSFIKVLQFISASLVSLGHGGNDAQKTMGIIALLLLSRELTNQVFSIPLWVVISCNLVMALGTLAGGWRIAFTLGEKITKLNPVSASSAQTAAATTLFLATYYGIPISTTHTVTGAIVGVGVGRQKKTKTHWTIVRYIVSAWICTLPVAAILAALIETVVRYLGG